jgi:hypothetical protein
MLSIVPLLLLSLCDGSDNPPPSIDSALAGKYLQEAARLWQKDAGRLWGRSLKGPLLFVDPRDRSVAASQADAEGNLQTMGSVFVGRLPKSVPPANTSITWAGVKWIMILWPLPLNRDARAVLMMHESYHRVQPDVGLPAQNPVISHLDTLEGRYWLQLEWRALAAALRGQGRIQEAGSGDSHPALEAITDALCFRRHRHRLFAAEAAKEMALEMNEGLAEYTGIRLSGMQQADQVRYAIGKLVDGPSNVPTLTRQFAYWSGPAYGLLIDSKSNDWLRQLKPTSDLCAILQQRFAITPPDITDQELEQRAARYQASQLLAKEQKREKTRKERLAKAQAKFIDGPVLTLPLESMQYSFDYRELLPLESHGTVYPTLQLTDVWGTITVKNGALMSSDLKSLRVAAPSSAEGPLTGDGWKLTLKPGWKLAPGERTGSYRLVKEP